MSERTTRRLLLVDDDPGLRMTLGDFLLMNGYDVDTASSGEVALTQMAKTRPDLIILDMGMPGMGGIGFLQRITDPRTGHTQVPVLVLTARSAMAEFFADKQIAGFITKPCDPEDLLREVRQILFMAGNLPPPDSESTPPTPAADAKTIVIADNNVIRNEAIRQALIDHGYSVESVRTGPEALEMAIARHPHGIILPLDLPEMNADEILALLRRLPASRDISAIVFGFGAQAIPLERITAIDTRNTTLVESNQVAEIIPATLKAIR